MEFFDFLYKKFAPLVWFFLVMFINIILFRLGIEYNILPFKQHELDWFFLIISGSCLFMFSVAGLMYVIEKEKHQEER